MADNRTDDLWTGGPWEQPSPAVPMPPPVTIPRTRPVLRTRRKRRLWPIFLVLALLAVTAALVTLLLQNVDINLVPYHPNLPQQEQQEEYDTTPPSIPRAATGTDVTITLLPESGTELTYTQIYQKNLPSMVSIEADRKSTVGTGTGVILTADGYILTNAHVVAGAQRVRVICSDNTILDAALVGFDAAEDLAVLKVEATGLTPAEFGNSALLQCGDRVAALGDPLGYRSTITDGIVSALDRTVTVDGISMTLIQTSAAINFGNSGGALINRFGQVVGITTIKIVSGDGSAEALGFAIPSQRVKYVADALIAGEEIRPGAFGISVLTRPAAEGLVVQVVDPAGDAYRKGLQPGDILTHIDGVPITGTQDLVRAKLARGAGDTVVFTVLRNGRSFPVEVMLVDADTVNQTPVEN